MSHYRYFISIILLLTVNHQVTAMGFLFGDNSYLRHFRQLQNVVSHANTFAQTVYQNRIPIAATAATTIVLTSYDKPIVVYSTIGLWNIYLLRRLMRSENILAVHKQELETMKNDVRQAKDDAAETNSNVKILQEDVKKLSEQLDAKAMKKETDDLLEIVQKAQKDVSDGMGSFDALRKEFGILKSNVNDLTEKTTTLHGLIKTEAELTRRVSTANADRVLNGLQNSSHYRQKYPATLTNASSLFSNIVSSSQQSSAPKGVLISNDASRKIFGSSVNQ